MSRTARERYEVLSECLVLMTAQLRMFSRSENMTYPKQGYEQPFDETRKRIQIIREMLRKERYESTDGTMQGL